MMNEWWQTFGTFDPENEQGLYPHPGQVVAHYRRERGWSQADLARRLGIQARMIHYLEKKQFGLDSISRRRRLVELLSIPPALLGLDMRYPLAPQEPYWWTQEGYPPFPAGEDGYPQPGAVIKHYRQQQIKRQLTGERAWTQADLAEALGISELAIRRMENHNEYLDSSQRRRMLTAVLAIPPTLLGLDARHAGPHQGPDPAALPLIYLPFDRAEGDLLSIYHDQQTALYNEFRLSRQPQLLTRAVHRITHLQRLAPIARSEHLPGILKLEFNYAQFVADATADLYGISAALPYVDLCQTIAQGYLQLEGQPDPGCRDLLANTLIGKAIAYFELGATEGARRHAEEALSYAPSACRSVQSFVLEEAARILAHLADGERERKQALQLLEQAERLLDEEATSERADPYFLASDRGYYHLNRARTLLALGAPAAALVELDQAHQTTLPTFQTRQLFIAIHQALAHLNLKEYDLATNLALQAALEARRISARRALASLADLHNRLKQSPYGSAPSVARLGWLVGAL